MKFKVYYSKNLRDDSFRAGAEEEIEGLPPLTYDDVINGHALIIDIEADGPNEVFHRMQAENWSPNGEARDLIEASGTWHTSMSVGDAFVDENGTMYIVERFGFRKIEKPVADVSVYGEGPGTTVFVVTPISDAAKSWVDENTTLEDWQRIGHGFAVDHRYIGDLIVGMQKDGLRLEIDDQPTV